MVPVNRRVVTIGEASSECIDTCAARAALFVLQNLCPICLRVVRTDEGPLTPFVYVCAEA